MQINQYTVSVIIPTFNSSAHILHCLSAIKNSAYPIYEIIVVDDLSLDNTVEMAQKAKVNVVKMNHKSSANLCRNEGARRANGDVLLFLDSDVVISANAVGEIITTFENKDIDAVVGLYSPPTANSNLCTAYKNLWIRYSYLCSMPSIDWIFGAVSAIRKDVFSMADGFKNELAVKAGIDDLELGKRLNKMNYHIILNPNVEGQHLKQFTLRSLLRNDFARSEWFVLLAWELREFHSSLNKGFVNVYPSFIISTMLSILLLGLLPIAYSSRIGVIIFILGIAVYIRLNFNFLLYFKKYFGIARTIAVIFILFFDHVVCAIGSAKGVIKCLIHSKK